MSPSEVLAAGKNSDALVRSPLLLSPTFRASILEGLTRTNSVGAVERGSGGDLTIKSPGLSMQCVAGRFCGRGFQDSRPAGKRDIRICDEIAYRLGQIDGFPEFDLEGTTEDKDRAIGVIAGFLRDHAPDLRAPAIGPNTPWWNLSVSLVKN
jgi:hypothetical protein